MSADHQAHCGGQHVHVATGNLTKLCLILEFSKELYGDDAPKVKEV